MANDSSSTGASSVQDTTPTDDSFFTDMQGEDTFFGPEQLAQAQTVVPVPPDQNVIRVQVNPGEIIELSPPFDPGATLLGREADGNLAIRVGDVTVILIGYVDANQQAPVVVETSDGQPIDVAILLASTDPSIDIQTAAGPGEGPQGQGADNTGALLAQLQGGNGLGGFDGVGAQDATELSYGTIDNAILLDREDALQATFGASAFRPGMGEAFLHDPIITYQQFQNHFTFDAFMHGFTDDSNVEHDGFDNDWADNDGTFTEPGDITNLTGHSTLSFAAPAGGSIHVNLTTTELENQHLTSNGVELKYVVSQDGSTVFAFRGDGGKCGGDGALIFLVHLNDQASTSADVVYFLVNRLDHATPDDPSDSVRDLLSIGVGFEATIYPPEGSGNGDEPSNGDEPGTGSTIVEGTFGIGFEDDAPVAHEVQYTSYYGNDDFAPDADTSKGGHHHHESFDSTADGKAYVDEDWVDAGNRDHDNDPSSSNSDPAHGDEVGRAIAKGNLNIDFGADGPAGADGNDCTFTLGCDFTLVLKVDTSFESGFVNEDGKVLDANGEVLKSNGHELQILSDYVDSHGIEHLIVGYYTDEKPTEGPDTGSARSSDLLFSEGSSGCQVAVFELTLDVNPDDTSGKGMHFQDFEFELYQGIDQPSDAPTTESNTNLQFKVTGHDDDGDAVHTAINIQVNDDAPTVNYISGEGADVNLSCGALLAAIGDLLGGDIPLDKYGLISSHDKGYIDEDFVLNLPSFSTIGNQDQDNTIPGSSSDQANGDDVGHSLVVGKVNFGADGPSGTTIAQLEVLTQGAVYEDKEGNTFTSGDPNKPLVVLFSNENFLVVGTEADLRREAVLTDDGLPVINGNVIFVVAMDNDPANALTYGGFVFYMNGPIDHTGQNEQSLMVHVGITAEDGDGDKIDAINIQINDDKPSVVIQYTNDLEHNFGQTSGGSPTFASGTMSTDYGRVDEDWLKGGIVSSPHYIGNQDKAADGTTSNANLFGDDTGKSEVKGKINVNYGADGPAQAVDTFALQTYSLGAGFPIYKNDGQSLFSGGVELRVLESTSGHLVVGIPGVTTGGGDSDSPINITLDQMVFEIYFDSADGTFDFKQWSPLDHPIHSAVEDNINLSFKVGSITDGDGDKVDAVIKIQVNDDTPETQVVYLNNDGVQPNPFGTVDEDWVLSGNGNNDADSTPGDTIGKGAVFFDLTPGTFGADGPGDLADTGFTAQENDKITVADDNGDPQVLKTADGHTVLVHVEPVSSGFHDLVGYFNSDDSVGYVDGTSTEVFTVSIDTVQGRGQFNLILPLQHPIADTEDNLMLTFGFNAGLTDGDGDPAIRIAIRVNDDAPKAEDDTNTPIAGKTLVPIAVTPFYQGNVLDNDKLGADGAVVTMINDTAVTSAAAGFITSSHGELEIHQDGSWIFHPKVDETSTGGCVEFCYAITDGDGDTSKATLTIDYVGPTHNPTNTYVTTFDGDGGNNTIDGADGNSQLLYGHGGDDKLNGNDHDDILVGGSGNDTLKGGADDDTLFGGSNDDNLYGGEGHDAMSGGAGNDTFHNVDLEDLDGTNTLDGVHSIDGGTGTDTVQLGGLVTFGNNEAARVENVEVLDFKANSNGDNQGTAVTLDYNAVYGITQIGGLHALTIHADKTGDPGADTITLNGDASHGWTKTGNDGTYDTYTAGVGAAQVTVHVDQDANVVTGP